MIVLPLMEIFSEKKKAILICGMNKATQPLFLNSNKWKKNSIDLYLILMTEFFTIFSRKSGIKMLLQLYD